MAMALRAPLSDPSRKAQLGVVYDEAARRLWSQQSASGEVVVAFNSKGFNDNIEVGVSCIITQSRTSNKNTYAYELLFGLVLVFWCDWCVPHTLPAVHHTFCIGSRDVWDGCCPSPLDVFGLLYQSVAVVCGVSVLPAYLCSSLALSLIRLLRSSSFSLFSVPPPSSRFRTLIQTHAASSVIRPSPFRLKRIRSRALFGKSYV